MTFKDLLTQRGVEWRDGNKDSEINICCPFCVDQNETEDSKFRLGINVKKGFANCFNCSWSSKKNTVAKVIKQLQIKGDPEEEETKEEKKPEIKVTLPDSYEKLLPKKKDKDFLKAYKYVRDRGITRKQIKKYKIGFCLAGRYAYRIVLPVYLKSELVGLVTRDFTNKQKTKYKNSKGRKSLYNYRKYGKRKKAVLIEGAIDCLACERAVGRVLQCMGLLGKSIKDSQIEQLKGYKEIVLFPDNDKPGIKGMIKVARKLQSEGFKVLVARLNKEWKDAGEAPEKEIKVAIKNAVEYTPELDRKLRLGLAFGD